MIKSQIEYIWLEQINVQLTLYNYIAQRYDLWSRYNLCVLCVQGDVGTNIPSTYKYHSSRGWLY